MSEVATCTCPTCGAEFETEHVTAVIAVDSGELRQSRWEVRCANGHEFRAVGHVAAQPDVAEHWLLLVPEAVRGNGLVERATDQACVCGEPIQPRQAYLTDPVRHVGCPA